MTRFSAILKTMHSMRQKLIGLAALLFGAAEWTPAGREFVRALFWERVIRLMDPIFAIPLGFILDYIVPSAAVTLGLYLLIGSERRRALANWVTTKLNWYLVSTCIFAACALVALALYFWDRSRGPVIWIWLDAVSPLTVSRSGDAFYIYAFNISGRNRAEYPITKITAYIKSNKTARILPLSFITNHSLEPASRIVVPAGEKFTLFAQLKESGNMGFDEFRAEFGQFMFSFEHDDGPPSEIYFSEDDVNRIIDRGYKLLKEQYDDMQRRERERTPGVIVIPKED